MTEPSARRELEAIVHPAVYRAIVAGLRGFELLADHPFAVVDVPLLFESGHEKQFDRIVVAACPPDVQLARLRARGMSDDEAERRLAAQWPTDRKIAGATYVVRTDGTFEDTDRQISEIYDQLRM